MAICLSLCVCGCLHVCLFLRKSVCLCISVCLFYVCMSVCLCLCVTVYVCVYVYVSVSVHPHFHGTVRSHSPIPFPLCPSFVDTERAVSWKMSPVGASDSQNHFLVPSHAHSLECRHPQMDSGCDSHICWSPVEWLPGQGGQGHERYRVQGLSELPEPC